MNVVLSDNLYIITDGLLVSRRTVSSMIVLIVYLLSRSYIELYIIINLSLHYNKQNYVQYLLPETLIFATIHYRKVMHGGSTAPRFSNSLGSAYYRFLTGVALLSRDI